MKKEFSKDKWKTALNVFADTVKTKMYVAVPYEMWRKYSKLTDVRVVYKENVIGIFSIQKEDSSKSVMVDFFPINDGSFGEYLYTSFFLNATKEEKDMTTITKINEKEYIDARVFIGNATKADKCDIEALTYPSITNTIDTKADKYEVDCLTSRVSALEAEKKEKEDKNMKNFNFDFGPCTNDQCHVSMYGIAVKNVAGVYVSYNPDTKEIVDVDILNFEGAKYMYKIPVALNDVAVGDVIIHNRKPMFVIGLNTDGSNNLTCVDVCAGEQKTIVPTVSPFGFNFVTKIVSLFNMMGNNTPSPDQPFGNMLPLMLMAGENKDIDPMMMVMFMSGNNMMNNPMMLYLLAKDNKDIDPMVFMAMSGMFNNTQPHVCSCGAQKA